MKFITKATLVPGIVLLTSLIAMPVSAHNGSDDTVTASTTAPKTETSATGSTTPEVEHATVETETEKLTESKVKTAGQEMHDKLAKERKSKHSEEEKKKNCKQHEHGLETKLANLNKNSQKHLAHIDTIYAKAIEYQQTSNLSPATFAELKAKADSAQVQAKASTVVLNSLSVDVDCTSGAVAQNIATFKAAAAQARTDILAYKDAVKNVLHTLESEKKEGDQ